MQTSTALLFAMVVQLGLAGGTAAPSESSAFLPRKGESVVQPIAGESAEPAVNIYGAGGTACAGQSGWNGDNMYQCGISTGAARVPAGECMARIPGVSQECGQCLGDYIHCNLGCITECCTGTCRDADACKTCSWNKCAGAFNDCAGPI
mmetsp:Transcript_103282/g.332756  ORF Transcript_103282/g.332756 Transcript_103282/m.332756 type:complete len:149 (-) Transcript_103282:332-778(-)